MHFLCVTRLNKGLSLKSWCEVCESVVLGFTRFSVELYERMLSACAVQIQRVELIADLFFYESDQWVSGQMDICKAVLLKTLLTAVLIKGIPKTAPLQNLSKDQWENDEMFFLKLLSVSYCSMTYLWPFELFFESPLNAKKGTAIFRCPGVCQQNGDATIEEFIVQWDFNRYLTLRKLPILL